VARNLRSLALGLALGVATDCESPAAQPLQRLGRDAARIVLLVFAAELLHVLVVALGEHCPPGLAHARDHGDCRPGKPNAWQARRWCRSPVGRTAGTVHAQVRSGGSRTSGPSCRAWPSHLPSPENRGGGAAATASSTAVNCASMVPGQSSRNSSAGTVPSGARIRREVMVAAGCARCGRPQLQSPQVGKAGLLVCRPPACWFGPRILAFSRSNSAGVITPRSRRSASLAS